MAPERSGAAVVAAAISVSMVVLSYYFLTNCRPKKKTHLPLSKKEKRKRRGGLIDAVGNTPLIRIDSLSEATGCEILGKCEFLNPGGSVKDRVAVKVIEEVPDTKYGNFKLELC